MMEKSKDETSMLGVEKEEKKEVISDDLKMPQTNFNQKEEPSLLNNY
jgi:hypothetical protein